MTNKEEKTTKQIVWENIQLAGLMLTIAGQILIGVPDIGFFVGQGLWLAANIIAVLRNIILKRPKADLIKDCTLTAITAGLITAKILGAY